MIGNRLGGKVCAGRTGDDRLANSWNNGKGESALRVL